MKKILLLWSIGVLLVFSTALLAQASIFSVYDNGSGTSLLAYTVTVLTTQLDTYKWHFDYSVYNVNQSSPCCTNNYWFSGLDGFEIEIPGTAVITNWSVPEPYSTADPGAHWYFTNKGTSLLWWGAYIPSVYPAGSTVSFSFDAEGVVVGTGDAELTTFWNGYNAPGSEAAGNGTYYSHYQTTMTAPAAAPVPLPAAVWLLGSGLVGLVGLRRKQKAA